MTLPILMYHSVSDNKDKLSISVNKFYKQMKLMNRIGFKTINFNEINNSYKKKFIITFDDGYENIYTNVLPILKEFNFKAICFFVTDYLGKHNSWDESKNDFYLLNIMNKDQVKHWLKSGMQIGSHTCSHKNLQKINQDKQFIEIVKSKNYFKEEFNTDIEIFSYPYGSYNNQSIKVVSKYYKFAVTTKRSRYIKDKFDRCLLPRIPINKKDSLFKFFLKIITPYEDIKFKD